MADIRNLLRDNAHKGGFRAEDNTLWLYDQVVSSRTDADYYGGVDAETFCQALGSMQGDVTIRINSPGGDVFAGKAMATAINNYRGSVTVQVDGYAASAASLIVAAADRVLMAPGTFLMIHNAWTITCGNAADMTASAALLTQIDATIAASYADAAQRRAIAPVDFAALMAAETWITPAQALTLGLADAALPADDPATEAAPVTAKAWNFSAYRRPPVAVQARAAAEPANTLSQMRAALGDLSALQPRQVAMVEEAQEIVAAFGLFDQTAGANGAHYLQPSPFDGLNCASCVFFNGGGCQLVAGPIDPAGLCKLWIIPGSQADPAYASTGASRALKAAWALRRAG